MALDYAQVLSHFDVVKMIVQIFESWTQYDCREF